MASPLLMGDVGSRAPNLLSFEEKRETLGDVFVPVESWGLLVNSFEELLMIDRDNENRAKLLKKRLDDFLNIYILDRWELFTLFFVSLRFNCDGKMSLGKVIDSASSEEKVFLSKLIFNHIWANVDVESGKSRIADNDKNVKQRFEGPLAPKKITEDLFNLLANVRSIDLKFPQGDPVEIAIEAKKSGLGINALDRLHAMFSEIDEKKPMVSAIKNNEQGFVFIDDPLWGKLCAAYERLYPLYRRSSYEGIRAELNEFALAFVDNRDVFAFFFIALGRSFDKGLMINENVKKMEVYDAANLYCIVAEYILVAGLRDADTYSSFRVVQGVVHYKYAGGVQFQADLKEYSTIGFLRYLKGEYAKIGERDGGKEMRDFVKKHDKNEPKGQPSSFK